MHIDWWTLTLQTVNVLVLIWLLGRFLFRPVTQIVARRQEQVNKQLADAAAVRLEADELRADLERARADIGTERDMLIADARKAAEVERTALLARANDEIAKLRAEADATVSRDRAAMESTLIDRTRELSVAIAQRLIARVPSATAMDVFLAGLCQQLQALPDQARAAFTSTADNNRVVDVLTAAPLGDQDAARIRGVFAEALGSNLALVFRSDPAVIAGIELHSRHGVVRSSWRGDLDRIREELTRGDQHIR
jgi:F-type H+-transporting ATPase subunit b